MTDLKEGSISDPKAQCLRDLLIQPFWEHLSTGSDWKKHIQKALDDSTKEAIEQDNLDMQEELLISNRVISEQEIKIKRMEDYIKKMHMHNRNAREAIDSAYNSLGSIQGMAFL